MTSTSPGSPLQGLLAAEHLAVYAYGLIGAAMSGSQLALARRCREEHVTTRGRLQKALDGAGATPTPAAPGYRLPAGSTGGPAAAVAVEEQVAATALQAVAGGMRADRATALQVLTDATQRAVTWRLVAGEAAPTVALPGLP